MQELNRLMRNKLKDFAQQHQEDFVHASSWPFRRSTEDDDVITLGCFIKGPALLIITNKVDLKPFKIASKLHG